MTGGRTAAKLGLMSCDDHVKVSTYGAEYRGVVQYYLLAGDVSKLKRLRWVAETSMFKTIVINDRPPAPITTRRKELVTRLTVGRCEWCARRGPVDPAPRPTRL